MLYWRNEIFFKFGRYWKIASANFFTFGCSTVRHWLSSWSWVSHNILITPLTYHTSALYVQSISFFRRISHFGCTFDSLPLWIQIRFLIDIGILFKYLSLPTIVFNQSVMRCFFLSNELCICACVDTVLSIAATEFVWHPIIELDLPIAFRSLIINKWCCLTDLVLLRLVSLC